MKTKKDILILKSDKDDYERFFIKNMQIASVDVCPVYTPYKKFTEILKILHIQIFHLPFADFWFGKWKHKIKDYHTVIVFDRLLDYSVIEYIHENNPTCRIILWFWNKVMQLPPKKILEICEVYSFDQSDCKSFNWKYNTQFYVVNEKGSLSNKIDYDVCFIGKDKGRLREIDKLYNLLINSGIKVKFIVVRDKNKKYNAYLDYLSNEISYEEVLNISISSRCIIELVNRDQIGFTLRTLEAIFFSKRLITNNVHILEEPFYNSEKIFILENESDTSLIDFVKTSINYDISYDKTADVYSYKQWLLNFGINIDI